jgi:hypothetical protein
VDGRRFKRARQLAVVVIVVGVVFGLAEAAVRARASVFPPPPRWVGPEMPLKERQIEFIERIGGASVAFVGSSVVDVAVDPSSLRRAEGERPYYNASTGAGSLRMISTWTRLLAVPKLRPDVVVLGVISREFNPNDPEQQRLDDEFFAAPAVRQYMGNESAVQKLDRRLAKVSALFRFRTFVRQPRYLRALVGLKKVTNQEYGAYVAPDGQYQGFLRREYPDAATVHRLFRGRALKDFEVGAQQVETFRSLVTFLKGTAQRVVVVNMPVTKDYVDAHPNGAKDHGAYTEMLEEESEDLDVELVDLGVWSPVYFADPAHLNARGAKRMTGLLDDLLAENPAAEVRS